MKALLKLSRIFVYVLLLISVLFIKNEMCLAEFTEREAQLLIEKWNHYLAHQMEVMSDESRNIGIPEEALILREFLLQDPVFLNHHEDLVLDSQAESPFKGFIQDLERAKESERFLKLISFLGPFGLKEILLASEMDRTILELRNHVPDALEIFEAVGATELKILEQNNTAAIRRTLESITELNRTIQTRKDQLAKVVLDHEEFKLKKVPRETSERRRHKLQLIHFKKMIDLYGKSIQLEETEAKEKRAHVQTLGAEVQGYRQAKTQLLIPQLNPTLSLSPLFKLACRTPQEGLEKIYAMGRCLFLEREYFESLSDQQLKQEISDAAQQLQGFRSFKATDDFFLTIQRDFPNIQSQHVSSTILVFEALSRAYELEVKKRIENIKFGLDKLAQAENANRFIFFLHDMLQKARLAAEIREEERALENQQAQQKIIEATAFAEAPLETKISPKDSELQAPLQTSPSFLKAKPPAVAEKLEAPLKGSSWKVVIKNQVLGHRTSLDPGQNEVFDSLVRHLEEHGPILDKDFARVNRLRNFSSLHPSGIYHCHIASSNSVAAWRIIPERKEIELFYLGPHIDYKRVKKMVL